MTAGTISLWYFHQSSNKMPSSPVRQSVKWAITSSFGSHCYGAITVSILSMFSTAGMLSLYYRMFKPGVGYSKMWLILSPLGWIRICCTNCFGFIIQTLTKYATIVHGMCFINVSQHIFNYHVVMTGLPFFKSGEMALHTLNRHFKNGVVLSTLAETVTKFSYAVVSFMAMISTLWVRNFDELWAVLTLSLAFGQPLLIFNFGRRKCLGIHPSFCTLCVLPSTICGNIGSR